MFYCGTKHSDILRGFSHVCCHLLHVHCWVIVVKNGHCLLNLRTLKSNIYIYIRPGHDAWAIACAHAVTHTNQEKGGLGG